MAQRGIREYNAKRLLAKYLPKYFKNFTYSGLVALVSPETDFTELEKEETWLKDTKLVVKPDQLFGKRGKHKLLLIDANWKEAKKWIEERMNKETKVGEVTGTLTHFLVEPFVKHDENEEWYVAIKTGREADTVYFSTKGGIFVEENWDKVKHWEVPVTANLDTLDFSENLKDAGDKKKLMNDFITGLYKFFVDLNFTYFEINPFCFTNGGIAPLDLVARVDDTAEFECGKLWGNLEFPPSFGTKTTEEEKFIKSLDAKSGSSLKLTILNPEGRIWTMVAGGGASVIYADTICDLGANKDLANYGEYSGNPTTEETYNYAKTILDLMTRKKDPKGKILLIGGGIANFTDVAKTFTGIIQALTEYKQKLIDNNIRIYVRRGGPNYKEGLANMRELGKTLGVEVEVYGPETHMTKIVSMGLGK